MILIFFLGILFSSVYGKNADWLSWSGGKSSVAERHKNIRFLDGNETGINSGNIEFLTPLFTVEFAGDVVTTPTVYENVVYVTDLVYGLTAVDALNGEIFWSVGIANISGIENDFIRSSVAILPSLNIAVGCSGISAWCYAFALNDGEVIWRSLVTEQRYAKITAAPVAVLEGEDPLNNSGSPYLFIGVSSTASYSYPFDECCTFRGELVKLNATNGEIIFSSFTLPDNNGRNDLYSGAAVWGSEFPIDFERRHIYITTGNLYQLPLDVQECEGKRSPREASCLPDDVYTDAIIAVNIDTGAIAWGKSLIGYEGWNVACMAQFIGVEGCPKIQGSDYDFSSGVVLLGEDLLAAGQKSGRLFVLYRDNGDIYYQREAGPGGTLGGSGWGLAFNGETLIMPQANSFKTLWFPPKSPPLHGAFIIAYDLNGNAVWSRNDPNSEEYGYDRTFFMAISRFMTPVTIADDVAFVATTDPYGMMYALDVSNGRILWSFESGASVQGGPSIVNDIVYWGIGYDGLGTLGRKMIAFHIPSLTVAATKDKESNIIN